MHDQVQKMNTYTAKFAENESVTQAVVRAVASVDGSTPAPGYRAGEGWDEILEPLYSAIDPEALDSLFDGGRSAFDGHLEFRYHGYDVTVHSDGYVSVAEP